MLSGDTMTSAGSGASGVGGHRNLPAGGHEQVPGDGHADHEL
jgi:hypothetical protein